MQKEKKQILLNTLAELIRRSIPKGKAPTTLAAEYGLSTSIMSKLLNGTKNPSFTTLFMVMEIIGKNPDSFMKTFIKNLPEDFTTLDL